MVVDLSDECYRRYHNNAVQQDTAVVRHKDEEYHYRQFWLQWYALLLLATVRCISTRIGYSNNTAQSHSVVHQRYNADSHSLVALQRICVQYWPQENMQYSYMQ